MKTFAYLAVVAVALSACGQQPSKGGAEKAAGPSASGRDQVWAAGSSTVFPFATRVAENVAKTTGGRPAKVESLGTGGGFKLFCGGSGAGFPDVANASRPIKKSEFEQCGANGVTDIVEIKIGYDGIVIANAKSGPTYNFKLDQVYRGVAAELPSPTGFAKNTYKNWKDVDASLPAQAILVYGPPPTSGTRDAFVELGLEKGARMIPTLDTLHGKDEEAFKARAHTNRGDGAWVDAGENDNAIVQTLTKTPNAMGVFGYSFLEQNMDTVKAETIDGIYPTPENISNGSYPLARSLYIYVKKAHIGVTPGLREFLIEFTSEAAVGRGGYLQDRGLVPLPEAELVQQRAIATNLTPMARPE